MCDLGRHGSSINHCLLLPVPCASLQLLGKFNIAAGLWMAPCHWVSLQSVSAGKEAGQTSVQAPHPL